MTWPSTPMPGREPRAMLTIITFTSDALQGVHFMHEPNDRPEGRSLNRRRLLQGIAAAGAVSALTSLPASAAQAQGKAVVNGRIRQSVVFWCFNSAGDRWSLERTCQ